MFLSAADSVPPPGTVWAYTLRERRWRCVQHCLFSCKASPLGCPYPADLLADLWDLLPPAAPPRSRVGLALHVDSFDADSVRAHCVPWILDPFSFLHGCARSRDAVCSVLAAFVGWGFCRGCRGACRFACARSWARASLSVCSCTAIYVTSCWALTPPIPPRLGC
jgi:hypothetical protein